MKILKILWKTLLVLLIIILIIVAIIFGMRFYNDYKFGPSEEKIKNIAGLSVYQDPTNLSLYNTNIENVTVKHIQGKYLNWFELTPKQVKYKGVIVTFGGSDWSTNYDVAVKFAEKWYQVLSLFFFWMPNQKPTLAEVPVEYFSEIEEYIFKHYWKDSPITIVAASKGSEYALLLSTYYPSISQVILYAPGSHIYSALDFTKNTSSWSKDGKPLPYIDVTKSDFWTFIKNQMIPMMTKWAVSFKDWYASSIKLDPNAEEKRIKVENTKANIVLFAGTDDQMWDSAGMAKQIKEKRPENTELYLYEWAGHFFQWNGFVSLRGFRMTVWWTIEANQKAFEQNQKDLYKNLEKYHSAVENKN